MTEPWDELAELLTDAADAAGQSVNAYATPVENIVPPAYVIRPDQPWMTNVDDERTFATRVERYAVACVANGSSPVDAFALLRRLVLLAHDLEGWRWIETSQVVQADSGGTTYLAATVRMTHSVEE